MKHANYCQKGCRGRTAAALDAAVQAALAGGRIIRGHYGGGFTVKQKGEIDLVTEADLASEAEILAVLGRKFAGAAFLAEESSGGNTALPDGPTWIIDPLDGTTNFAHGFPWFCVSIAYAEGGVIEAGVIYAPVFEELFVACRGCGTFLNGNAVKVSKTETLQTSLLATGFPYTIREHCAAVLASLGALLPEAQGVRRAGSAALDLAGVACGRLDGFWEIMLKPWDTAAGFLMVQEAGGRVSDFAGREYSPLMGQIAASNGRIHPALLQRLNST